MLFLEKISNLLEKISCQACIYMGVIMVSVTAINIFSRFFLNYSIIWSNELARYMFIWTSLLGSSVVLKRGQFSRMTMLIDSKIIKKLPYQKIIYIIIEVFIIIFSLYAVIYGWIHSMAVRAQLSPAMHISMFWVYISIPISFSIMLIHVTNKISKILKKEGKIY